MMSKRRETIMNLNVRLPADLHSKLVEAATSNSPRNSLNSEILQRLYDSFKMPNVIDSWEETMREQQGEIRRLAARVAEIEQKRK